VVAARTQGNEADGWLLIRFDRRAFRAFLEREQWSARDLARTARLSPATINQWLSGVRRPRLTEWRMAAEALALDVCGHCGGSGTIDPTEARVEAITRLVQRRNLTIIPDPEPPVVGDGWRLDRNALTLSVGGTTVQPTQQEARLVALLAAAEGSFVTAVQLGAALQVTNHAIHTYITRLREKCTVAGVEFSRVVQNGHGAGYRAVMANREEVAS
jgi:transcriptional regulator with XRE-family HTH domain/biotin operon repressor